MRRRLGGDGYGEVSVYQTPVSRSPCLVWRRLCSITAAVWKVSSDVAVETLPCRCMLAIAI